MKKHTIFAVLLAAMFFTTACKKEESQLNVPKNTVVEVGITAAQCNVAMADSSNVSYEVGVCWGTNPNPTLADNTQEVEFTLDIHSRIVTLTGLTANTTYYVRSYATNEAKQVFYGASYTFTTQDFGLLMDIQGNAYKTVQIGNQTWMAENLEVAKYTDGTIVPLFTDTAEWRTATSAAACEYNNVSANSKIYGKLYNWYAVQSNKICPAGWHVPTYDDWKELRDTASAYQLQEIGTTHWTQLNENATNETAFTALPAGYRDALGSFSDLGNSSIWWTSTLEQENAAYVLDMSVSGGSSYSNRPKRFGASIRCVKNQ